MTKPPQGFPDLPPGWFWQPHVTSPKIVTLTWPDHGHVTLDLEARRWGLGWLCSVNGGQHAATYHGPGFKRRMVEDAVAALKEIYKEEK